MSINDIRMDLLNGFKKYYQGIYIAKLEDSYAIRFLSLGKTNHIMNKAITAYVEDITGITTRAYNTTAMTGEEFNLIIPKEVVVFENIM